MNTQPDRKPLFCTLEDCTKPYYSMGYCTGHYQRFWKQLEVYVTLAPRWKNHEWKKHTSRVCNDCNIEKDYSEFYTRAGSSQQPQTKCKTCVGHRIKINKYRKNKGVLPQASIDYFEALGVDI